MNQECRVDHNLMIYISHAGVTVVIVIQLTESTQGLAGQLALKISQVGSLQILWH